ncbi:MAG: hypothetical protein ABI537_15900 [Casimicrobiaceae bacterium]
MGRSVVAASERDIELASKRVHDDRQLVRLHLAETRLAVTELLSSRALLPVIVAAAVALGGLAAVTRRRR